MRLLNVRTLRFAEFITDIPRYAIASHRWTAHEATIDDLIYSRNTGTHGYKKIEQFCKATQNWDGDIQWLWIDTCCIDKKSSAELQEAINSMFRWYLNAEICFAYLADVCSSSVEWHVDLAEFQDSEWFRRGWTLQELLAPRAVVFLSKEWVPFGHKGGAPDSPTPNNLNVCISKTTAIPESVLANYVASKNMTVEQRVDWVVPRETTRIEDKAYCLLGIFDIYLPLIYGEGTRAYGRLFREIRRKQMSQDSIESLRQFGSDPRSSSGSLRTASTPATTPPSTPDFGPSLLPFEMQKRRVIAATEDRPGHVDRVPSSQAVSNSATDSGDLVGYGDGSTAVVDFAARSTNDLPTASLRNTEPEEHPVSVKVKAYPDGRHVTLRRLTEEEAAAERANRRRARRSQRASSRASSTDERSDKQGEHESEGQTLPGVPKISRWSRTTYSASKEDRPSQDSFEISETRSSLGPSACGRVFEPPNDRRYSGHGSETQQKSDATRSDPLRDQGSRLEKTLSPSTLPQNLAKGGHQHNDSQTKNLEQEENSDYRDSMAMRHPQPPSQTSVSPSSFDVSSIFVQHEDQDDDGRTTAISMHEGDNADSTPETVIDVGIEQAQGDAKDQAAADHLYLQHPQPRAALSSQRQSILRSQVNSLEEAVNSSFGSSQRPVSGFDPTIWGLSGVEELARFGLAQGSDIWSAGPALTSATGRLRVDDVDEEERSSNPESIEPAVALAVPTHHSMKDLPNLPNEGAITKLNKRGQDFDVLDDLPATIDVNAYSGPPANTHPPERRSQAPEFAVNSLEAESAELDAKSAAITCTDSGRKQRRCEDVETDHEKEEQTETSTNPERETTEAAVVPSPIQAEQSQTEKATSAPAHVTSSASASAPDHVSTASITSFPHAFERWESLSCHWEGLTSYWLHRLEQNTEEIRNNVPNAAMLTRHITDMSAAGANLYHAVAELQRLRASSERKFQRWFFETRADNERNMEIQAGMERQVQSERQFQKKAIQFEATAQATIKDANREIAEMRRETWIAREEARCAWAEINRQDDEAQQNLIQLNKGGVVNVGGVMVVSRASVTNAIISLPRIADVVPGIVANPSLQTAPDVENGAKDGAMLVPGFGASQYLRQQKPQVPIRGKQIGTVEELDYGLYEIKPSAAPGNNFQVNGRRTEMDAPGPEASQFHDTTPSSSTVERQVMPDTSSKRQNDQISNLSKDRDQTTSSKGSSQAGGLPRRSTSRERLTQKIMKKLDEVSAKPAGPRPQPKAPGSGWNLSRSNLEKLEASQQRLHPPIMRSRSELADIDDQSRVGRRRTTATTASTSRIANNPKLLEMVEDTIKRMILPEINALEEDQSKARKLRSLEQSRHGSGGENESLERRQDRTTLRDITNVTHASKTISPSSYYTVPEDGRPITISTQKINASRESGIGRHDHAKSQTSLLIEYFEASKTGDKSRSRPSVRVKVTPSPSKKASKMDKTREIDADKVAGIGQSENSHEADAEAKARDRRRKDRKRRRAAQAEALVLDCKDVGNDERSEHIEVSNNYRCDCCHRPDSPRPEDSSPDARQSLSQVLHMESIPE